MRTCVGTDVRLHLIKPLGFEIDDRKLRRSAVDYYDSLILKYTKHGMSFTKIILDVIFLNKIW